MAGRTRGLGLWDDDAWRDLVSQHVQLVREAGALSQLPLALNSRVFVHLAAGELAEAASLAGEAQAATEITGSNFAPYGALGVAAWQGRETDAGHWSRPSWTWSCPGARESG